MSQTVANLPVELSSVAEPLRAQDELLTADELKTLTIFESLEKTPSFEKFPGSTVLRRCQPGRLLCSQGDAGATAFYILTTEDVLKLRERQLESVNAEVAARASKASAPSALSSLSASALEKRRASLVSEVDALRARGRELAAADETQQAALRHAATAHLLVDLSGNRPRKGLLHQFVAAFTRRREAGLKRPQVISIDGPVDINANTLKAPLREGELMGEMSCLNRAPRSATVIAERECYMLEMLRNVLDMLHKDKKFKQHIDDTYRRRVLEGQIRNLPLFESLTDAQFDELSQAVQLVDFPAGAMVFEEGDESDCFYIVRSGLVRVLLNAGQLFRDNEIPQFHWSDLARELRDGTSPLAVHVWQALPAEARTALEAASTSEPSAAQQQAIVRGLNQLISAGQIHRKLGKNTDDVLLQFESGEIETALNDFPSETENWSELEARTFHRLLIEYLAPAGVPRRMASRGKRRTLAYIGRGELIGEMGVLRNELRSATCVAYDHPEGGSHQRIPDSRTGAVPSRLELVRIDREPFQKLIESSAGMREHVQSIVAKRLTERARPERAEVVMSREFEQLGLIQGQQLMLIDLDRCTRCGACVDACVQAHDDGFTRLYLDGPRYEKYLVPLTCRSCLDPVCMIGCPVGAINRGESGEIVIRDWCIGCRVCAEQCPYGSIQMNDVEIPLNLATLTEKMLEPGATLKAVDERAVVCDLCSSTPSRDPACVYACPHDAAFRVNAHEFLFEQRGNRHTL